ncbi:MAG: urease subunit gamma [Candidatus Velamenicoccus archaeovorus]
MQLGPKDRERLRIFQAAELARRTLERGLRLNAPEAVALVCDEMHMAARAGASFEEVAEAGRSALRPEQLIDGVADLVPEIRVEVLLEEGTRLIVLREPFGAPSAAGPGAVVTAGGQIELTPDRERLRLIVRNASRRPVRVSSHYPFWRTNPALEFDREAARGFRLDLPAGDQLRWGPGETREVVLVRYGKDETR